MKVAQVIAYLESIAPLELQESYDNSGLIIGNSNEDIRGILFSLDATEEVIEEAIQLDCNFVISHHPILFHGIKKLNGNHYVQRSVIKAIKNNIQLYAIHTNLDNILHNGVNAEIGNQIGLKNYKILLPKPGTLEIGAGIIGDLDPSLELNQFLDHLKQKLGCHFIKYSNFKRNTVSKVAVCGGSGAFLIPAVLASSADVFITSDLKYHEFFEGSSEISLIDIGHYESEKYTIGLLYRLVTEKFTTFASHCTKINTNPINYY